MLFAISKIAAYSVYVISMGPNKYFGLGPSEGLIKHYSQFTLLTVKSLYKVYINHTQQKKVHFCIMYEKENSPGFRIHKDFSSLAEEELWKWLVHLIRIG